MSHLEFMQPFDGFQPEISPEEQNQVAELFVELGRVVLLKHVGHVEYRNPETLNDRLPYINLVPLDDNGVVRAAQVLKVYNPSHVSTYVRLNYWADLYRDTL